jgi:hypothetical protein
MKPFRVAFLLSLSLSAFSTPVSAQQSRPEEEERGNLIKEEIDDALKESKWQAGAFRFTPTLLIGAGYDSNSLSSPFTPVEDSLFRAAPGIRAVVPMRNAALLDLYQELHFLYYRDLDRLRGVFPLTRVGGALGGKNIIVRIQNEFRQDMVRPTTEFDFPLDQRSNRFNASLGIALGWRQELSFLYEHARYRLEEDEDEEQIRSFLNRDLNAYVVRFTRHLTAKTDLLFEGLYEELNYVENDPNRDGTAIGAVGGFAFSPIGQLSGLGVAGYKRIRPQSPSQADYNGLVGSVDVRTRLGRRMRVRGVYSRDAEPSILQNNWFFIENRYGGFLDVFLASKLFVRPGAVLGTNDYPRPVSFTNDEGQSVVESVYDRFQIYSLSVNYHLTPGLILRVGSSYLIRNSNLPAFDKDRLLFNVGLTTEVWPRPQAVSDRSWTVRR